MEETAALTQPWYRRKPIPVFVIAYFSVVSFIFMGIAMFENMRLVQTGSVTLPDYLSHLFPNTFIGIAGTLLLLRKESSLYLFVAALVVIVARFVAAEALPNVRMLSIQPSAEGFALVLGILIYCLHLKHEGYFK